jgi:DNA-binding ferritin-like protein
MKISMICFYFLATVASTNGQNVMKSAATVSTFLLMFATVPNIGHAANLRVESSTKDIPGQSTELHQNGRAEAVIEDQWISDRSLSKPDFAGTALEFDQETLITTNASGKEPQRYLGGTDEPNEKEYKDVMEWIKHEVYMIRNPFCWKRSYANGSVGTIPGRMADCEPGYINDGATCRRPPKNIYAPSHMASCPRDYTNFGLTCTRKLYTGDCKWYTPWYCDTLRGGPSSMTCRSGYFKCGGRCCKNCPHGYTNTGEFCHQSLHVTGLWSMTCKSDEDKWGGRCYPKGTGTQGCHHGKVNVAGLCYNKCRAGYYATIGMCWQKCDNSQVDCAWGCAKNDWTCGEVTTDMVLSVFVVAANIVTMGVSAQSTNAIQAAKAGGASIKSVQGSVNVGKKSFHASKLAKALKLSDGTGVVKYTSSLGKEALDASKRIIELSTIRKYTKGFYLSDRILKAFLMRYSHEFAEQTSREIRNELVAQFGADMARKFIERWGILQLATLIKSEGWGEASVALAVIGLADPTGVAGVVNAYLKPSCKEVIPFPCTRFNKGKGCGKLKFADHKKYTRRRLEAALNANTIEEEFETCNDQKYELFLYVEQDGFHIDMVGKPLDLNKDECKKAFVFDDYDTGDKLVSHTEDLGFVDDWHERALSLGTFPLMKIEDASNSATVINPLEYNLVTNNCATFVIEMMGYLGVPVTKEVASYTIKALMKSPDLVEAVRGHASAGKILAPKGKPLDNLSDEEVVSSLVWKYVEDHKQPVLDNATSTGASELIKDLDDGSNEKFEIVEEPVYNMYEKFAEEHKDEYIETLEDEYEKKLEEESGPRDDPDAEN